ncbi:hypothetical protein CO172_00140, partial [Candidatus Uhrbacteria bacterium CG_4_9_14_3_um_filter_36_7]
MIKTFIQNQLFKKARRYILKYNPRVVAITGSVGKTSTREAIALVLKSRFKVRTAKENYNNEFGVPLTILGKESPGRSWIGWIRLLCSHPSSNPEIIVLEFGADHPGDIAKLCMLVSPQVGVLTAISPVHLENYASIESLIEEKSTLIRMTSPSGLVVLNADDARVLEQKENTSARVETYGFSKQALIRGSAYTLKTRLDDSFEPGENFSELSFHAHLLKDEANIVLPNVLGRQQVSAALAALCVGSYFGIPLDEMVTSLRNYKLQNGRLRPLAGIKGTLILDDTYNAAPASMIAALEVLRDFEPLNNNRRIAVLGNMAELGAVSSEEHRHVGLRVAELGIDLLVCVGEKAQEIGQAAKEGMMEEERILYFSEISEAGHYLDH